MASGYCTDPHRTRMLPLTEHTRHSALQHERPCPLFSPLYTEHVRSCDKIGEMTQAALLLCTHDRNVLNGFKQVASSSTCASDKTHQDPESSYLKTGKHVAWALFKFLKIEQCALSQRQEVLPQHQVGVRPCPQLPQRRGTSIWSTCAKRKVLS